MDFYSTHDKVAEEAELKDFCEGKKAVFEYSKKNGKCRIPGELLSKFRNSGLRVELAVCSMLGTFAYYSGIDLILYSTSFMDKEWKVDFNINLNKIDHYVQLKWNNAKEVEKSKINITCLRVAVDSVYKRTNYLGFTETGSSAIRRLLVKTGVLSGKDVKHLFMQYPTLYKQLDNFWEKLHVLLNKKPAK